jgi:thiol-disulfide isomerase/thioredoxin
MKSRTLHIFVAAILLLVTGCRDKDSGSSLQLPTSDLEFTLTLVDGTQVNAQDFLGDIVMINFWDTWCAPCRNEQPDLNRLHVDFHERGFTLIGISFADLGVGAVQNYLEMNEVPYTSAIMNASVEAKLGSPASIPYTYFINKNGEIFQSVVGGHSYDFYASIISPLLND